ncbi:MAG: glycosyltransferase family 4 protein [Firmicutes bacterium]|nr:glycosyltransferase family 4 protein [Bacillota bacterium]
MNILLINHYAGSNIHGMEYRPFYLAREWVRLGHQVTIVAASFSHLRSKAPVVAGSLAEEYIEGVHYIWLKTPPYQGNGLKRVLNMLAFIAQLFRFKSYLIDVCKPDVVIASSTYPLDIYPAYRIAKKTGAKLIFEVHDLWPLSPVELGGMSPYHPYIVFLQIAENFAYRVADWVVSLLPKANMHMEAHGMAPEKFVYIPNGIDVAEWQNNRLPVPDKHKEVLTKLRQTGRFIVGYTGSHGLANALYAFIEAASLLKNYPVTFVLIGQGPEKSALEYKARDFGLENTIFLPPVSKGTIPALLDLMHVLYIGLKSEPLFRFGVSPNKLMDYMMAAKPIIHAIEAGNDLVAESGCGISVPPEDPAAIAEAVLRLMQMSDAEREIMGQKGKDYVLAKHDYRVLAEEFLQIMLFVW